MRANNILETVGNTPHIRLNRLFPNNEVWIKLERTNPGGSIKDRIAIAMIEDAEHQGLLKPNGIIVEPTSGNTGIGLAIAGAVKGYKVILVMPESMSIERRKLLQAYGAELVLTPRAEGMKGAIQKAQQIVSEHDNAWMPMQFDNRSNPLAHYHNTANEIITDFPNGFDYLVTGVGTGGHISGIGERLKQAFPFIKVVAVEPANSPVISGGNAGPHPIQGIGAGFIPKNLNTQLLDSVITIEGSEAFTMVKRIGQEEGILVGISTGASLAAIEKLLENTTTSTKIITFGYDTGERYLSVEGLF
ncbi:MAG: cysteine synthase A [Bacteroidales bacterium]|nr:cysteine synthase A [Bacteroidales bacterium]MBN2749406.1 cysteine synthase A [Bacteroidales bacterium]